MACIAGVAHVDNGRSAGRGVEVAGDAVLETPLRVREEGRLPGLVRDADEGEGGDYRRGGRLLRR